MIKIGLCDDNKLYLEQLSKIIKNISISTDIKFEISIFNSGESLLDFYSNHKDYFDILFLDILMDGINGVDLAKSIRNYNYNEYIIFITTSKEYALDSYSVNAYNYILKPFSYDTIEKLILDLNEKINLNGKNIIYVKNNQDICSFNLNNVIYFESNLRKITAHLLNGEKITFYNKMSTFENELSSNMFVRCHRSFLVNLVYLKSIIGFNIITTTNDSVPISKKYLNSTRDIFTNFIKSKLLNN
ncbi:LytR/AlgR family response regulator transcription factor [Clostridium ihumii]|uniref:LytR/AlgR family response regulator transcription factor n=1 Tax=Clostridium ihumii TaxID=1470356 RepID=UPI00058B3852|nr:LytTR family DNA-binding domain-containing protein [Clostridium ihumii]